MKYIFSIFCIAVLFIHSITGQVRTIELKDNFFYIDGQKTFLKGISYEAGAIPGQNPWERSFDEELLEFDMNRISSAGFNTIRTWGITTQEELEVLKNFDINILMGIWIGSGEDFSDPDFVDEAINIVNSVLSYSKNYDNIIGYLIHNEPLPEAIFTSGYAETVYLWQTLADIIHGEHPGRPVSISNTCVGNYINPAFFDISAYNLYPYNPATINHSHGYTAYVEFLKEELQDDNKPLIITEYGLSVSPTGPGNWGYGGNTLQEQEDGILHMFSSLLDGGASGANIFIYSDGWWKNSDPTTHDDAAEEWFGLVNYTDVTDKYGTERPVWEAVKEYQNAIITSPRNSNIYSNQVLIEIFSEDIVDSMKVFNGEEVIYQNEIQNNYLTDTLEFNETSLQDFILHFKFYDESSVLVKEEDISCLISAESIELPSIEITTDPEIYSGSGNINVTFSVTNNPVFSNNGELEYVYYPHLGWDYGDSLSELMSFSANQFEYSREFTIDNFPYVISFAAGFDITYGNFTRRIHADKTLVREDLSFLEENNAVKYGDLIIYPNPSGDYIYLHTENLPEDQFYGYKIFDLQGRILLSGSFQNNQPVDIQELEKGYYIILFETENQRCFYKKFVKR